MLYVEADNSPAIAVYERLGFTHWDTDVMFALPAHLRLAGTEGLAPFPHRPMRCSLSGVTMGGPSSPRGRTRGRPRRAVTTAAAFESGTPTTRSAASTRPLLRSRAVVAGV